MINKGKHKGHSPSTMNFTKIATIVTVGLLVLTLAELFGLEHATGMDGQPKPQKAPLLQAMAVPRQTTFTTLNKKPILTRVGAATQTTKEQWLRQAGIPEKDWVYADYIVTRESGWRPDALGSMTKTLGRACGLVQALPCSKLGSNWKDPVHALKWQYSYVKARYGGYAGAYRFWSVNHWY